MTQRAVELSGARENICVWAKSGMRHTKAIVASVRYINGRRTPRTCVESREI